MSGENSKKSGEIGEKLASSLLNIIGWKNNIHNISIDCNRSTHLNSKGGKRQTHGEDHIFLFDTPFHDDRTDIIHISDKNINKKYPISDNTLKTKFKEHVKELSETINCSRSSSKLYDIISTVKTKKQIFHYGLLIWLQNDLDGIEKDIKPIIATSAKMEIDCESPIFIIDNARASFLVKVVKDLKTRSLSEDYEFYYPRIGSVISQDAMRTGKVLPLELIVSDIIPAVIEIAQGKAFVLYANESFDKDCYKKLIEYALKFADSLITTIYIGMPDYNAAQNKQDAEIVRAAFKDRKEEIIPFGLNFSPLSLLEGN